MRKVLIGIVRVLDSNWFAALFIASIIGSVLWAGGAFGFWPFDNPTQRLEDAQIEYSEWETFSARHTRFLKRTLFSTHCEAIDAKEVRGEQIQDARFLKPCQENDIELYFKVRAGDFPQVVR